jgi:hypothetical protein
VNASALLESTISMAYIMTHIGSSNRGLPSMDIVEARKQLNDEIDILWFTNTKDLIKAADYTIH